MADLGAADRFDNKLARIRLGVTAAATAFEARWTLAALARVDSELHAKLSRQIGLWHAAMRGDSAHDLERQGQGLVRGYQRAAEAMALSGEADDAFYVGHDPSSGLCIAIGHQMASAAHAQEAFPGAIFLTPDEVAMLVGKAMSARDIDGVVAVKRAWPGAVVMSVGDKAASWPVRFGAMRLNETRETRSEPLQPLVSTVTAATPREAAEDDQQTTTCPPARAGS